jgi:hypothetical protein
VYYYHLLLYYFGKRKHNKKKNNKKIIKSEICVEKQEKLNKKKVSAISGIECPLRDFIFYFVAS